MTLEMRRKLAREPYEDKIRKVSELLQLVRTFPRKARRETERRKAQSGKAPATRPITPPTR